MPHAQLMPAPRRGRRGLLMQRSGLGVLPGVALPNATAVAAQYGVIVPAFGTMTPAQAQLLAGQLGNFGVTLPEDVQKGVNAISGMLPAAIQTISMLKSGTPTIGGIAPLLCAGLAATGVGTVAVAALGAGLAAFSTIATALGLNQQPPPLETCIWSAGNICNNRARPYGPSDPTWVTIEQLTGAANANGGIPGVDRLGSGSSQFWGDALGSWWSVVGFELYMLGDRTVAADNWATQERQSGNNVDALVALLTSGKISYAAQAPTWATGNVPAQWAALGPVGLDFCRAFDHAWIKMSEVFINGYAAPDPSAFIAAFITAWNTMHGSDKTVVFDGTGGTFLDFVIDGGGWTSVNQQPVVPQRISPTQPVNVGAPLPGFFLRQPAAQQQGSMLGSVALGTATAVGVAAGGLAIYSHVTRQSFTGVLKALWSGAKGLV